jgi:hypothetical protein
MRPAGIAAEVLSGSGVTTATAGYQGGDERAEKGFAPAPGVVHELEEAEAERQACGSAASLRDAPVRAEPGAQQGPGLLHGVDVDLAGSVAVLVTSVFAPGMADRLVPVSPRPAGGRGRRIRRCGRGRPQRRRPR